MVAVLNCFNQLLFYFQVKGYSLSFFSHGVLILNDFLSFLQLNGILSSLKTHFGCISLCLIAVQASLHSTVLSTASLNLTAQTLVSRCL